MLASSHQWGDGSSAESDSILAGNANAYVKLRIQNDDHSDWAGDLSSRKSKSSGHVEADGCLLTSFLEDRDVWLRAAEWQSTTRCARLRRNCYTLDSEVEHDPLLRLSACARHCAESWLGKVKALAVKTLWLQEVGRERGLQIKSIASKGNKADLGTKVLPVARLRCCGTWRIVKLTVESETELDPD